MRSAATIARAYDAKVRFIVDKTNTPPGFTRCAHWTRKVVGLDTCSMTSKANTASNLAPVEMICSVAACLYTRRESCVKSGSVALCCSATEMLAVFMSIPRTRDPNRATASDTSPPCMAHRTDDVRIRAACTEKRIL